MRENSVLTIVNFVLIIIIIICLVYIYYIVMEHDAILRPIIELIQLITIHGIGSIN